MIRRPLAARASYGWSISGMGAIASIGEDVDEVFDALCSGRSGLAGLRSFQTSNYRTANAYEIDDRVAGDADRTGRATQWLCRATKAALADAGLGGDLADVPMIVGTGLRELRSVELWWRDGAPLDSGDLHFGTALREAFGATTTYTFSNACSASLYALGLAADLLALDKADAVVVAGVDSITESMFGLLDRVHLEPPDAVRPFDRKRKGVLMGEGAAAVVLRRPDNRVHVPRAHGSLRAVGMNCDAYHPTAPDPAGIARCMREAQDLAGVSAGDVDLVLVHGTGTVLNDQAEAWALNEVFTAAGASPLMTGIKSMTGHTSGGSGLLSVIVAVRALQSGRVPPIIGVSELADDAAGFRLVRDHEEKGDLSLAQVNAFGFGGVNAVALIEGSERHG